MASTKTVTNAITRVQNEFKGVVLASPEDLDFTNEINEIILKATRWDFMLTTLTPFGTTDNTQDYDNVPADFLWAGPMWYQDNSTATNPKWPLHVKDSLQESTFRGGPSAISVDKGKYRLFPVPSVTHSGSGQWLIGGDYYALPTRLSAVGNTFQFDDAQFEMFTAGLTARVAQFLDDIRAGVWKGKSPITALYEGTGLWGKFAAMLNEAVASENRSSEEPVFGPTESLAQPWW